ncbi:MAG: [FeFe] hydrogenase H-cluster maturation GTPase HydF [Ruminococcaceae bacterium]|nr:[FeFe] hydrogenase H-cluster maturation GTPase HydF [Oscillospiraceae bacterium]
MGLNDTVSAERIHITFFGNCNAGKSSLVNAVLGQKLSVVSALRGTTTDPVKKAMELLPLGPVVITDTAGLDDESAIGSLRTEKTKEELSRTDIAVLVIDGTIGETETDRKFRDEIKTRGIPFVEVVNKADVADVFPDKKRDFLYVSAVTGEGIEELKVKLGSFTDAVKKEKKLVSDLVSPGDIVVMVTPVDESSPKGRIILPQQMVLRELLDIHAILVLCQVEELHSAFAALSQKPRLVITDSRVFGEVSKAVSEDIPLTSFSILMARYKGELDALLKGVLTLGKLSNGDKVLISEACTHHRQCNDIGTVKMPEWIRKFSDAEPEFSFTSGRGFPEDVKEYSLVVHCGGCMINDAEMQNRIKKAEDAGIPMINYGMAIAAMQGVLKRSLVPFGITL